MNKCIEIYRHEKGASRYQQEPKKQFHEDSIKPFVRAGKLPENSGKRYFLIILAAFPTARIQTPTSPNTASHIFPKPTAFKAMIATLIPIEA